MNLTTMHAIIILVTVALVIGIGIYHARSIKSAAGYSVGGRSAGVPLVAGSIAGTVVGGGATVGTAQLAYSFGLSAWWFTLGSGIAFIIMGIFYARRIITSGRTLPMYKAVIFDMDGTILDTITDITDSVNYALARMGERHDFTADRVKLCFGSGIRADMEKTLALSRGCSDRDIEFVGNSISVSSFGFTEKDVDRLESIFNPYYTAHSRNHTGPYEGIEPLLRKLKEKHVLTAVASNKNDGDVKNLSDGLFPGLFALSMGNSPAVHRKPAPDMIDRILQELGVPRSEAVYVGDSEVDIETAKNSQVPCISVAWGFRTVEFLKSHGASVIVNRPEELASLLLDSEQHACGQSHRHGASGF